VIVGSKNDDLVIALKARRRALRSIRSPDADNEPAALGATDDAMVTPRHFDGGTPGIGLGGK
jgi:hypothetical protein